MSQLINEKRSFRNRLSGVKRVARTTRERAEAQHDSIDYGQTSD